MAKMGKENLVVWTAGDDIPNISVEKFLEGCVIANNRERRLARKKFLFPWIVDGRSVFLYVIFK